jgi:hypothetical protein
MIMFNIGQMQRHAALPEHLNKGRCHGRQEPCCQCYATPQAHTLMTQHNPSTAMTKHSQTLSEKNQYTCSMQQAHHAVLPLGVPKTNGTRLDPRIIG